jgi:hypothetical protein
MRYVSGWSQISTKPVVTDVSTSSTAAFRQNMLPAILPPIMPRLSPRMRSPLGRDIRKRTLIYDHAPKLTAYAATCTTC